MGRTGFLASRVWHRAGSGYIAEAVVIKALERAIGLHDDGVDGAHSARQRVQLLHQFQGIDFVRQRQVAAAKPQPRQATEGLSPCKA